MATYPADPNLPAITSTSVVSVDFLNTLVDNVNAIGANLGDLTNNTADGNLDLGAAKGIEWADVLKIYFSAGDIIIDDGVQITGNLDVALILYIDSIDDSGASTISVLEDIVFAAGKYIDAPTGKFDVIDDSGAVSISILEDVEIAAGKYIDAPTGKFDVIDDSGAAVITFNENIEFAAGKGIQGTGAGTLIIPAGAAITGNLDVSGTLSVDNIDDSGAAAISILEDVEIAATKYIDAPTGKFDVIDDSGAAVITFNEDIEMAAAKGLQGTGAGTLLINAGAAITGNLDVTGTLTVDTIDDSGAGVITIDDDVVITHARTLEVTYISDADLGTLYLQQCDVDVKSTNDQYLNMVKGTAVGVYLYNEGAIFIRETAAIQVTPAVDGAYLWASTTGDLRCTLRSGGVDKTRIIAEYDPPSYAVSNELVDRTYDANTVAIAELADVVGTMINDLALMGIFLAP